MIVLAPKDQFQAYYRDELPKVKEMLNHRLVAMAMVYTLADLARYLSHEELLGAQKAFNSLVNITELPQPVTPLPSKDLKHG